MKTIYDIHLNTPATGLVKAAQCVVEEIDDIPRRAGFRYLASYLEHKGAFALDPEHLPLIAGECIFDCGAGLPGLLDDYLPDAWGRKLLARWSFHRHQRPLPNQSVIALLALMDHRRIGALCITPTGEAPQYLGGLPIEHLARAEAAGQHIDNDAISGVTLDELSMLYLASSGSGVGGARPKALIAEGQAEYLAKFNRPLHPSTGERYNNARVELACLRMAACAGMEAPEGIVLTGINGREVLLVTRFDVVESQHRAHMISIASLLKDRNPVFSYDAVHRVLQRHSTAIGRDAEQLLRLMLFNRAINNLDDHERNISLINDGTGYRLAPAYDLVPSIARGQYPAAGFGFQPFPPKPSEVRALGKVFGLSKPRVAACADQVIHALNQWDAIATEAGVSPEELRMIEEHFNP